MTAALFAIGCFLVAYVVGCAYLVLSDAERDLRAADADGGPAAGQRRHP